MTTPDPAGRARRYRRMAVVPVGILGILGIAAGCAPTDDGSARASSAQGAPPAPAASAVSVQTLAKVGGWRDGFDPADASTILEIAYDEATAQLLWDENVPGTLPTGTAPAFDPAVYGSIEGVDFTRQVVALYSSGESGSCPSLVSDVATAGADVSITTTARGTACTDDYRTFSAVLVLDAADLPPQDRLDGASATVRDLDSAVEVVATVSTYASS